jgi:hypothetical protein
MPFIFDTNSLRVLGNYYPDQFPSFWQRFENAVEKKDVLSVREVLVAPMYVRITLRRTLPNIRE